MAVDLSRDAFFTAAWFGLMAMVWLGWAQEDPPKRWRAWLGAGSTAGVLLALAFGYLVARSWDGPSALEDRYHWFGVLVAAEVVAAGTGCWVLARRGAQDWFAWWVAVVVALHLVPLGLLLESLAMTVAGAVLTLAVVALLPPLRRRPGTTSAPVGVVMGGALLLMSASAGGLALLA
jgi:hypothetical protein